VNFASDQLQRHQILSRDQRKQKWTWWGESQRLFEKSGLRQFFKACRLSLPASTSEESHLFAVSSMENRASALYIV
jgi:hypothetical protein